MYVSILTIVFSMIGSGIIGVFISIYYQRWHENYLRKLEVFKNFMGDRYTITEDREYLDSSFFFRALNQIFVMYKSEEVRRILESMHSDIIRQNLDLNSLVKLYKAMCKELDIGIGDFTDEFFLKPFGPARGMK